MNAAIITARRGLTGKNMWAVAGKPICYYPMQAAKDSKLIDAVYVTSDSEEIKAVARALGVAVIDRPAEHATDESNHGDSIKHAVEYIANFYPELENVAVLLGNTVMPTAALIDLAMTTLNERPEADSVMSVMALEDIHPSRANKIDEDGYISMFYETEGDVSTNRQDYEPAYAFDGKLWAFRREAVLRRSERIKPWWWIGEKCVPIIAPHFPPVRDVHDNLEMALSEWWVEQRNGESNFHREK